MVLREANNVAKVILLGNRRARTQVCRSSVSMNTQCHIGAALNWGIGASK